MNYAEWPSEIAQRPAYEVEEFWQFQKIRRREFKEEQKQAENKAKRNKRPPGSRVIHRK